LDVDLLVLRDLGGMWEMDLGGAIVGAVTDWFLPEWKARCGGIEGLPAVPEYFNSGVLLLDMEQWRRERVSERALVYLQQHPETPFCDQDALNVVCSGKWKEMGAYWNHQNHFELELAKTEAAAWPGIVHFITGGKPWKAQVAHPSAGFYDQVRKRTRFARSFRQQFRDGLQGAWPATKARLRRNRLVRNIWSSWKASHTS